MLDRLLSSWRANAPLSPTIPIGGDYRTLPIGLPVHIYHALSETELQQVTQTLLDIRQTFFGSLQQDGLKRVAISPSVIEAPDGWRDSDSRGCHALEFC